MEDHKVKKFMQLAGQHTSQSFVAGSEHYRKLGAQLLLSEVLEYCIHGLGVEPEFNGVRITKPNDLSYHIGHEAPDKEEMLDGLSDVAYTMYWNAVAFGMPLEEAFELVCDNNLEKFVKLDSKDFPVGEISQNQWHCEKEIDWPKEVVAVHVIDVDGELYAVGKDATGKVRKPSSYQPVNLSTLLD